MPTVSVTLVLCATAGKRLIRSLVIQHPRQQEQIRLEMLRNVYGSALPARMALEKQILGR